ncbi:type III polyketide synthase [Brevundimonas vesicularis]|uniref:type III polyketide synthase n=1 Tax=Brevundimonas vesicularis TaxID=41276 RepID=UPI00157318CD|nr:3-oxoacyl-[acyl-carrier-protein] synthase III C-terminal domain-containing protein [Brevundimonas vesicularis]
MPPPAPRLNALALAWPPHVLKQQEVAANGADLFATTHGGFERLAPIYANALIETRHSCVPLDWYLHPHSFSERNNLFLSNAVEVLADAAARALSEARLQPKDIDAILVVCTTGVATPALDARLMQVMPFRPDVRRLPIFGLGCAGGVVGLARAADLARAYPEERVLLLVVELCALTFRAQDRSKSNLVATALFGDGAAAAVISCREDMTGPVLGASREHTWPNSVDVMGWDVADDGLKVVFSRDIPTLVQEDFRPVATRFLADNGLTSADVGGFVCHPGGAKVIDALETCFELTEGSLSHTRKVLRDHGNMSAATVLFVLKAMLGDGVEGPLLLTTLGPGFAAGLMLVHPE